MLTKYNILNIDCANCAAKIENHLKGHALVKEVSLNFPSLSLHIDTSDIELIRREIKKVEPKVEIELPQSTKTPSVIRSFSLKKEIFIISIAFSLFCIQLIFEKQLHKTPLGFGEYLISLTAFFLAGWNVLKGAFNTIRRRTFFDENVLMTIATLGAFAIHAISEAVGVMIFFKIGELLQNLAITRSRRSIKALLAIKPDYANLKTNSGIKKVPPEMVYPDNIIIVKPGEKVPLDGIVTEGVSFVNTAALTGESVPSAIKPGEMVLAGEVNTTSLLTIKVTKSFVDSSISKILNLVENATANKAKTEQFITRFAHYYTPVVVITAVFTAFLPPLLMSDQSFSLWIYRALVLLVISCPCALVVSIPLGYFGGLGGASKRGILVKGSNFIDILANVSSVCFDKTGTLTKGTFTVREILPANGFTPNEVLSFAAIAESHTTHPIAKSILDAANETGVMDQSDIIEYREVAGHGVIAKTKKHTILAGNEALLNREKIDYKKCTITGTVVYVCVNKQYTGSIIISDEIKDDALHAIKALRKEHIKTIGMLSGDNRDSSASVADKLGLDYFDSDLLPEDKVAKLEKLLETKGPSEKIAFIGDGINDSPSLARADVGIAMGARGSDVAIETADVVLISDDPSKVADAIRISKGTKAIVWQNIVFALTIKVLFVSFGAFGLAGMWEAVFADVGTALIAVLNSMRAFKV